jgi:hypothetical protein
MSLPLIILLTITWYEFFTSMSDFEILMLVRIFTVLIGVACLVFILLHDNVKLVFVAVDDERDASDMEEVKENLAKQVDPVPAKEESEEFADLLGPK